MASNTSTWWARPSWVVRLAAMVVTRAEQSPQVGVGWVGGWDQDREIRHMLSNTFIFSGGRVKTEGKDLVFHVLFGCQDYSAVLWYTFQYRLL